MNKFKKDECVYVKATGHTGIITKTSKSCMGHNIYYLDTNGAFDDLYPFNESEISSIDEELEKQDYSLYLDKSEKKIRHSLLVAEFMEEVLAVAEFGAEKYAPEAWKTDTTEQDSLDALYRHYLKHMKGQEVDTESGCSHMAHISFRSMMAYFHMKKRGK